MAEVNSNPKDIKFWQDKVAKARGTAVFLPDALIEEVKAIMEVEAKAKKLNNELAKMQVEGSTRMGNVWMKFREHLEANGNADNWLQEVGLDQVALDNGFFIVNVIEKGQR